MTPALEIKGLHVRFGVPGGRFVSAVRGVDLRIAPGETVGLVGESGCGKSSLAKAIVGLAPVCAGSIRLSGLGAETRATPIARARLAQLIFQDNGAALDPRHPIGKTLAIPFALQATSPRRHRSELVRQLIASVGLPETIATRLPHELSGGQRQRVGIARALALSPKLIVCDEPVSALDVSLQAQVLNLLRRLQQQNGTAYLFVSHDLSVIEHMADRVAVMYLGRIVEIGDRDAIWSSPAHPYTRALIDAVPRIGAPRRRVRRILPGDLPSPLDMPGGCAFHSRCPHAFERCRHEQPELTVLAPGHASACHLHASAALAVPMPPSVVSHPSNTNEDAHSA